MARSLSSFGWLALCAVALTACGPFAPVGATATASGARSPSGCYAPAVNGGAPQARSNAAFAFDIDRGVMVLFGGGTTQQPGGGFADTWTWDVQGWTKQDPSRSPAATSYAAMAYDLTHHYMVLYEPAAVPGATPQTWTWDGVTWTQQNPVHTPPSRVEPAMANDPSRGGVVLVGGTASGDRSDIWAWNGSDWIEILPDQGAIFGSAHSVIVSPKNGSLLVAGNLGAYLYGNGAWSPLGVPWPAGAGFVGNVAYDVGLGFVRFDSGGETWTWRPDADSGWSKLALACSPPGRWANAFRPAMAFDERRDLIVLFGGRNRNDTWTFDGTRWAPAAGGAAPPATPPPPPPTYVGSWARLASLATGRIDQTATVLRDGRVLVVGGSVEAEANQLASVEIFDPKTNRWSAAAAMAYPRARHTATLLGDGRVLVVGGLGPGRGNSEIYDPKTNTWSSAGNLISARANHQAVQLSDGRVLVMGGRQPGRPLASAEIFDPQLRTWTSTASLVVARDRPQAVLLSDGKVLVTGGVSVDVGGSLDAAVLFGSPLATSEIYDAATKAWTPGPTMSVGRVGHSMAVLGNGDVFVVGGTRDASSAEILDSRSTTWSSTTQLAPRIAPVVGVLAGGSKVIVVGGLVEKYDPATVQSAGYTPVLLDSADVFDTGTGSWSSAPPIAVARWQATGSV
ncbi:MAG TPA: kelch repeat-containing protein, partial [Chloroflexota bacterium]|nr:kelch repeat-containing protein [Chloroflexota bacterium]